MLLCFVKKKKTMLSNSFPKTTFLNVHISSCYGLTDLCVTSNLPLLCSKTSVTIKFSQKNHVSKYQIFMPL